MVVSRQLNTGTQGIHCIAHKHCKHCKHCKHVKQHTVYTVEMVSSEYTAFVEYTVYTVYTMYSECVLCVQCAKLVNWRDSVYAVYTLSCIHWKLHTECTQTLSLWRSTRVSATALERACPELVVALARIGAPRRDLCQILLTPYY